MDEQQSQNPNQYPQAQGQPQSQLASPLQPEKKGFLRSTPGKTLALTLVILAVGLIVMYGSGSIGLKGDFTETGDENGTPEGDLPADGQTSPETTPLKVPKTPLWRKPAPDTKILSTALTDFVFEWEGEESTSYEWKILFKNDASMTATDETFENKEGKTLRILAQSSGPITGTSFKLDPLQISQPDLQKNGIYLVGVRATRTDATTNQSVNSKYAVATFILEAPNEPPQAPTWVLPDVAKELALEDLEKTEFIWTAGTDPDSGPKTKQNFQFAIIKGELTDQKEIADAFSALDAEVAKKYEFAWLARWTDKKVFDDTQKLTGDTTCIEDMGASTFIYTCTKFKLPIDIAKQIKGGQKYTVIAQGSDGKSSSPYALLVLTIKKADNCPLNQYYISDSKNGGCKKVPSAVGAFSQAGFICSVYKTIATNPDNSYRLSAETKTALQKNIDADCSKKPDDKKICQAKMTFLPKDKELCEPFKSIVDPALSKDVCDQYGAEKSNPSLSQDTKKQIETNLTTACKPKICPTGKYLNGPSVPENCEPIAEISTIASPFDKSKACEAMKKIAASDSAALETFKMDQLTLDQIKAVAKSEACNPKPKAEALAPPPSLSASPFVMASTEIQKENKTTSSSTECPQGKYLSGTTIPIDCKAVPDLFTLSAADIPNACALYRKLNTAALDGKMDTATRQQVKKMSENVLCYEENKAKSSGSTPPPSLTTSATPQISQPTSQTVRQSRTVADSSITTTEYGNPNSVAVEPLTYGQANIIQPRHPVSGSSLPDSTSSTGPELWIYAYGALAAYFGSQTFKKKNK
jgi:hypothetical protein